ncbi:hypothetical protein [Streptomyces sp. V3I7]|uniref:hypothetical protein n=1 Tax=Streptomyces sp. V3I7 TaxID=3042278 RepID=UPI0027842735|nr:hypothetical protein [Streptomyces sp. V3I7]MDQ0992605.1 putative membrane protein YgcG [Streptomyces sp. V3I7]
MANAHRQLRSTTVVLGGMGLLAAALTSCSSAPDKRCVDRDSYQLGRGYQIVADKNCTSTKSSINGAWYYGGKKKSDWVSGGSFTRPSKGSGRSGRSGGHSYGDHDGVHRGGFGSKGGGSHGG